MSCLKLCWTILFCSVVFVCGQLQPPSNVSVVADSGALLLLQNAFSFYDDAVVTSVEVNYGQVHAFY